MCLLDKQTWDLKKVTNNNDINTENTDLNDIVKKQNEIIDMLESVIENQNKIINNIMEKPNKLDLKTFTEVIKY